MEFLLLTIVVAAADVLLVADVLQIIIARAQIAQTPPITAPAEPVKKTLFLLKERRLSFIFLFSTLFVVLFSCFLFVFTIFIFECAFF